MISDFRLKHGEGRVTLDKTLTRIAHEQAAAMAAKDQLDHDVLGRFNTRVSPAGAGRAAENIAYGYDSFPKTLDQWVNSSGHRRNLLPAQCLARWRCQCEKLGDRAHVLGNGDRRRLRASQVDQSCKAISRWQAEGPDKGSLPNKNSEYLPLMEGLCERKPCPLLTVVVVSRRIKLD